MFLLMAFVFGFGMAATVLVGQAFGRGDVDAARRVVGTAIGGFMPLAIAIARARLARRARSAPPARDARPTRCRSALAYLRVIFIAMPAVLVIIVLMMALRGSGDAMTPLWFMLLVVLLDSALNPVFILGLGPAPALGIAGSATATVIANYRRPRRPARLHLPARPAAAAARRRAALSAARSGAAADRSSARACRWACR